MEISLSKVEWMLMGYYPWVPLLNNSMETGLGLKGATHWIPATVPGGVHYDLYQAGYIEHPHNDMNSLKCEWIENRWWLYKTTFSRPENIGHKVELIFKGLDYKVIIFLNGTRLGEHEGMYHPAVFDITSQIKQHETMKLEVLFENAPDEMGQIGKTSLTHTQKSRFNYKWDFSTRMVNVGIWDDVLLKIHQDYSIGDLSIHSDVIDDAGVIDVVAAVQSQLTDTEFQINQGMIHLVCKDPQGKIIDSQEKVLMSGQFDYTFSINVKDPCLWYPNGHGEQPLYEIQLKIISNSQVCDHNIRQMGIRKLSYNQNVNSPEGALPYTFVINDKKIYIKGVNMTPLDLLYGNVTLEHYEWLIFMMKKANVNMVRIWGGGIIEKELFYDLCDRNGIMIWQEFIQSSSGYDNIPSKGPEFLALLAKTAVHALTERRNHVSLTVWSGGNELMSAPNLPSTYEDENIAMLQRLVKQYDPQRLFLPTSASGPVEFITAEKGVSHDVHGQWKYMGNPEHYELYGESDNLFHSEFGVDGMSSMKSLRKFLSDSRLTPRTMDDDLVWRHHGEWWDTFARDEGFFGPMKDLDLFARSSQWIQAEGLRYIVEANRRRKFQSSGSIIWQLNEPWPNISCTCLVDYYGEGKMAYYWVRNAFAPLHATLDYRKLHYEFGETFRAQVFIHGNGSTEEITVTAEVLDTAGEIMIEQIFTGCLQAEQAVPIGFLSFEVSSLFSHLFCIRLKIIKGNDDRFENVYYFSTRQDLLYESALQLRDVELVIETMSDWQSKDQMSFSGSSWLRKYTITNNGNHAALHVHPIETSNAYWMEATGNFVTIFPHETKEISVCCFLKQGGGFHEFDQSSARLDIGLPEIAFEHFTK